VSTLNATNPAFLGSHAKNSMHSRGAQTATSAINHSIPLKVTAANTPLQAQAISMPAGTVARIRTHAGNVGTITIADSPGSLLSGFGQALDADVETVFPFEKGRVWYMGSNVGDQADLSVRSQ
jgi:hypothetical protein